MPDPIQILESLAATMVAAVVVVLLANWPWKTAHSQQTAVGCLLGVAAGFVVGCWRLQVKPNWPPIVDQDRLLLVLLPAVVLVEVFATVAYRHGRLVWPLRGVIAATAAWILLYNSSYLADLAGPGSREWTPTQVWVTLCSLALSLLGVWFVVIYLEHRCPTRAVPLSLSMSCVGAAITVMLSGYASGGQLGFPLAAAVAGAIGASLVLPDVPDLEGVTAFGVVGLFSLLVVGLFFGRLAMTNAILLGFSPLLCWLPELLPTRRWKLPVRNLLRLTCVALPIIIAVALAQQKFVVDSSGPSSTSGDSSVDDYLQYK